MSHEAMSAATATQAIPALDAATWRRRKRWALAVLAAVWTAAGFVQSMTDERSGAFRALELLISVATIVATVFWCTWDGHERGTGRRVGVGWIALFAVVAVPVHLFRSRGFRGGLVACLLAFLYLVALVVLSGLAFEAGLRLWG